LTKRKAQQDIHSHGQKFDFLPIKLFTLGVRQMARKGLRIALALVLFFAVGLPTSAQKYRIGIVQLVEHPSLDDSREGFLAELRDSGFMSDVEVIYRNAQNDPSLLSTIVRNFINERVHLIQAITTPAAQSAASLARNIPIVFSAVRDPIAAGLIDSFEQPGGNITGSSHFQPASEQAALIFEVIPSASRVGVVYNAGEVNAVSQVMDLRRWATDAGIRLVERTVSQSVEVQQATESLVGQVDVIFVPTDNTVVAGLEGMLQVAMRARIPVVAADVDTVSRGAVAAYGADFFKLGRLTAQLAISILRDGVNPGAIPIAMDEDRDLAINLTVARQIGLEIPSSVIDKASIIH